MSSKISTSRITPLLLGLVAADTVVCFPAVDQGSSLDWSQAASHFEMYPEVGLRCDGNSLNGKNIGRPGFM